MSDYEVGLWWMCILGDQMVADLLAVGGDLWLPQFQLHSAIKFFLILLIRNYASFFFFFITKRSKGLTFAMVQPKKIYMNKKVI